MSLIGHFSEYIVFITTKDILSCCHCSIHTCAKCNSLVLDGEIPTLPKMLSKYSSKQNTFLALFFLADLIILIKFIHKQPRLIFI